MRNKFTNRVYEVVAQIPKGYTATYKEVAEAAGHPGAWRAVGSLLSKNYDSDIPCHRVIRSDGRAGGYNRGKQYKILLLEEEVKQIRPLRLEQ